MQHIIFIYKSFIEYTVHAFLQILNISSEKA